MYRSRYRNEVDYLRLWHCLACDVQWRGRGDDRACWLCGSTEAKDTPIVIYPS